MNRHYDLPRFHPWEGNNYERSVFGLRLLIVGHSHYSECPISELPTSFTQDVFRRARDGEFAQSRGTFSALERTFKPLRKEAFNLWNEIAFYNYLQSWIGTSSSDIPPLKAFHEAPSPQALVEVLHKLRPEVVLILGTGLFKTLSENESGPVLKVDTQSYPTWRYATGDGDFALAIGIKHPGKFYPAQSWTPVIEAAIEYVKRNRNGGHHIAI